MKPITILGDGAFGTAVAQALAHQGHHIIVWCNNAEVCNDISCNSTNTRYLPGIILHENVHATTDFQIALNNDIIFQAIPMIFLRETLTRCAPYLRQSQTWVSLTKGIEESTLCLATEVIGSIGIPPQQIAALSGPSYARELAENQPTGLVVAAHNQELTHLIKNLIHHKNIVIQQSSDMTGIQLVAALKNVVALAIGILDGAGYRANTQALLLMRMLEEIKMILKIYQIDQDQIQSTLFGLAGIGDMTLTCFGKQSRNYRFGYGIGQGTTKEHMIQQLGQAPEGVNTLVSLMEIQKKYTLALPIGRCINGLVDRATSIDKLIQELLQPRQN